MQISEEVKKAIEWASSLTGVNPTLLAAIGYQESRLRTHDSQGRQIESHSSVRGIFQITGLTWKSIHGNGVSYDTGIYPQAYTAAMLVRRLQMAYGNNLNSPDMDLVLIAYNGGEGVANRLRGKPITLANVEEAIRPFRGQKGFGPGKEVEVYNYAGSVKRWYNAICNEQVFNTVDSAIANNFSPIKNNQSSLSIPMPDGSQMFAGKQSGTSEDGSDKSFLLRLMGSSSTSIDHVAQVSEKTDFSKSKLVANVKSGLANIQKNGKVG